MNYYIFHSAEIRHQNNISEILQSSTIMKEKLDKIRHEEDVEVSELNS